MTKEEMIKRKEKLKADLLYRKEHWDEIIAEIFENLEPFKTIDDIPDIQKVKEQLKLTNKKKSYQKNQVKQKIIFMGTVKMTPPILLIVLMVLIGLKVVLLV